MSPTATDTAPCPDEISASPVPSADKSGEPADEVLAELLVEEISIDGMCGVY